MSKDYYKVLGISKTATQNDVKAAFKKLARKYHPDVNPEKDAEKKFKEASEAYEVLGDEKKRKQYDTMGSFNFGSNGPHNPHAQNYWQSVNINDIDLEDIFGDVFGFGGPKRGRRAKTGFDFGGFQNRRAQGTDINWTLPLDFIECANGCEKHILLHDGKKIKVRIPAGVNTGSKVRLAGKGHPGIGGGNAGDLIIEINCEEHPHFVRDGDNVLLNLEVSLYEALKGAVVKIPTASGMVEIKIPPGSQSGQKLRLRGKGIQNAKTGLAGDQYVTISVKYPQDLSRSDKEDMLRILSAHGGVFRAW